MQTYKDEQVTFTRHNLEYITCDLCGAKSKLSDDNYIDIDSQGQNVNNTTIEWQYGWESEYGDGGYKQTTYVDMCPTCFRDKLIPWLESQSATVSIKEYDW